MGAGYGPGSHAGGRCHTVTKPIRGGTDGARLSWMGLPTPNLFTGGMNYHGRYECIPTFAMEKAVEVLIKLVELGAQRK